MGAACYVETCFITLEGILGVFDQAVRRVESKVKASHARQQRKGGLLSRLRGCASPKATAAHDVKAPVRAGKTQFLDALHAWFGPADPQLAEMQRKSHKKGTVLGVTVEVMGFLRRRELLLAPAGLTTGDVCYKIVVPAAEAKHIQGPLLRYFFGLRDSTGTPLVGPVMYFASHAWRYQYVDFVRTLRDHASLTYNRTRQVPYYWVDLVSKDQLTPQPSTDEFKTAIKQAKHVVAVLDTLDKPVALS